MAINRQMGKGLFALSAFAAWTVLSAPVSVLQNTDLEAVDPNGHVSYWTYDENIWTVSSVDGMSGTRCLVFNAKPDQHTAVAWQRVKAMPGAKYFYGARGKAIGLVGTGSGETCAKVLLTVEDKAGKYITYYTGGYRPTGTTDGFWPIESVTPPLPKNAGWLTIRLEVVGSAEKGTVIFDDPYLMITDDTPIDRLYCSAYRNTQAEGSVVFAVGLNPIEVEGRQEFFTYVNADGKLIKCPPTFSDGTVAKLTLPVSALARGEHEVSFTVSGTDGKVFRTAVLFTRSDQERVNKIGIDRFGRCLADGIPFLPIGMYWSVGKASEKKRHPVLDVPALEKFAKGPFNCIMPYCPPVDEVWDACAKKGIRIIYPLAGEIAREWDPDEGDNERAKKAIEKYRNHPALLAWYLADELPIALRKSMIGRYEMAKRLDPEHPSWVCLYQVEQLRDYLPTFDVLGVDCYPITEYPIGRVSEFADKARLNTLGVRPMWFVPQAFDWSSFRGPDKGFRMPTREEMSNMGWQAIAGGANGLVYYSYTYMMFSPKTSFEQAFADVCSAASEVKRFERMILLPGPSPKFELSSSAIAARTWSDGKSTYALLVNKTREKQTAKFSLEKKFESVKAGLGSAPMSRDGQTLAIELEPIAQTILKLN